MSSSAWSDPVVLVLLKCGLIGRNISQSVCPLGAQCRLSLFKPVATREVHVGLPAQQGDEV